MNTIEEALKQLKEIDEVDDSEMYEDLNEDVKKTFEKSIKEFILSFGQEEYNESFESNKKLGDHFTKHCLANDLSKKSKRSNVFYDFNNLKDYKDYEIDLDNYFGYTFIVEDLGDVSNVIYGFRRLFEGSSRLIFSEKCNLVYSDGNAIKVIFKAFANENTKNYSQNTVDYMIKVNNFTKTLFPLDANYVENKFNSLVSKWHFGSVISAFKINH